MPGIDGFELCLEIRRDPGLANVPVVLLSGQYGSKADQDLARRVGANALVLRTPDFGNAVPAILEALRTRPDACGAAERSARAETRAARDSSTRAPGRGDRRPFAALWQFRPRNCRC